MPAVTRIGDDDEPHCGGMVRAKGSGNVFANGIAISRQSDPNTAHCGGHSEVITVGSTTVFVNNLGCGRVGDDVGGKNCTAVKEGSPDVFAGG